MAAQIKSQSLAPGELASVIRARSEVLETISRWIHDGGGAQDALDDPQLHSAMLSFFRHPTDHAAPVVAAADLSSVQHGFSLVNENLKAVFASFSAQTMRPIVRTISVYEAAADGSSAASNAGPEPPDIDQLSPEALVNNLDSMAAAAFRNVTQEVSVSIYSCVLSELISFVFRTSS